MSTIFTWEPETFDHLPESGELDPLSPYVQKHFRGSDPILEAGYGAGRFVKYPHDRGFDCGGIKYSAETVQNMKTKGFGIIPGNLL
jgi:hypothetical protein